MKKIYQPFLKKSSRPAVKDLMDKISKIMDWMRHFKILKWFKTIKIELHK